MENPHLEHDVPQRPPTPDKTPRIAAFVVSQQAFLVEYTVAGRAHLDRCLDRDAKRQAEVERKQAKALRVAESIERESSTGSSLRSSGIVKRMRRKDGSCPGDTGEEIILSRAQVLHGNKPEKVGIEESENGLRGKSVKEVKQMEMDKENQPPPPSNSKAIPKQEKRKERLDEHKSAKHNVLQDLAKSSAKGKKRKAEVEETASQTSSAKRRHERKMRRREKAAIRKTPSKPLHTPPSSSASSEIIVNCEPIPKARKVVNQLATDTRRRKGNLGLNMMASFSPANIAQSRITLCHGAGSRVKRGFLGGGQSSKSYKPVVYRSQPKAFVKRADRTETSSVSERESPPLTKFREVQPATLGQDTTNRPDKIVTRQQVEKDESESGGSEDRQSGHYPAATEPKKRGPPRPSPSWPDSSRAAESPAKQAQKTRRPTPYTSPTNQDHPSSEFKSIFHIRTDTVDSASPQIKSKIRHGNDEPLLRHALQPLKQVGNRRVNLAHNNPVKQKIWFRPPKATSPLVGHTDFMHPTDFQSILPLQDRSHSRIGWREHEMDHMNPHDRCMYLDDELAQEQQQPALFEMYDDIQATDLLEIPSNVDWDPIESEAENRYAYEHQRFSPGLGAQEHRNDILGDGDYVVEEERDYQEEVLDIFGTKVGELERELYGNLVFGD